MLPTSNNSQSTPSLEEQGILCLALTMCVRIAGRSPTTLPSHLNKQGPLLRLQGKEHLAHRSYTTLEIIWPGPVRATETLSS